MSHPFHFRHTIQKVVGLILLVLLANKISAQAAGDVDPTFNPDDLGDFRNVGVGACPPPASALYYQKGFKDIRHGANGMIWLSGISMSENAIPWGPLRLMYPDGNLDSSYFPYGSSCEYTPVNFVIDSYGRVISSYGFNLIRQTLGGTYNGPGFYITGGGYIHDLEIQADDKLFIAGDIGTWDGQLLGASGGLIRLDTNGVRDPSFSISQAGIMGNRVFYDLMLRPDSTILAIGDFEVDLPGTNINSVGFIALHADGTLDTTITPTGTGMYGSGIHGELRAWPTDDKILVINGGTSYEDSLVSRIFLLDAMGNLDPSVLSTIGDTVFTKIKYPVLDCAIYPDGRMLFVGASPVGAPVSHIPMVRVFPNGTVDTTFNPQELFNGPDVDPQVVLNGPAPVVIESVLLDYDGSIYCGGQFTRTANGAYRNGLMKLDSVGNLHPTFMVGNGFNGFVNDIVQLADGRYVVAGDFTTYRGQKCRRVACLTEAGELDTTFQIGVGIRGSARSLAVQPDGMILVGGKFSDYNGQAVVDLIRLTPDGVLDQSFAPLNTGGYATTSQLKDIAVQTDGKIIVSGSMFWTGYTAQGIARFFPDGSRDTSFDHDVGFNGGPASISIQPSGKIVCGGSFTTYGGLNCEPRCCRLNSDGSLDAGFNIPGPAIINFEVHQVLSQPDGKVLLSGPFNYVGSHVTYGIGRMNADGSPDVSFSAPYGAGTPFTLQADGRIISSGPEYDGVLQQGVLRMFSNADWDPSFGQPDSTWGVTLNYPDVLKALLIDNNQRVLVAGNFRRMRGQSANGLVRLYNDFTTTAEQEQVGANQLNVWPNPSAGVFTIALPWIGTTDQAILQVVNATGQRIQTQEIGRQQGTLELDLTRHAPGAYSIQIIDTWGVVTAWVICE